MEVGIEQIFLTKEALTVPRLACSEVREKEICPIPSLPQNVPINDRYSPHPAQSLVGSLHHRRRRLWIATDGASLPGMHRKGAFGENVTLYRRLDLFLVSINRNVQLRVQRIERKNVTPSSPEVGTRTEIADMTQIVPCLTNSIGQQRSVGHPLTDLPEIWGKIIYSPVRKRTHPRIASAKRQYETSCVRRRCAPSQHRRDVFTPARVFQRQSGVVGTMETG